MSTDPTATVTASTAAPPPPQKGLLARAGDAVAGALHAAGNVVDRIGEDVAADLAPVAKFAEADLVVVAKTAIQQTAAGVAAFGERNKVKLATTSVAGIMTYIQTQAPGLAIEAASLAPFITTQLEELFTDLDGELQVLANTGAPAVVAVATAPKAQS